MRTWLGLWRAVIHRSRADWPVVAAAWALLLCAISLLVAGVVYSETVATAGLRQELRAAAAADRSVVVRVASPTAQAAELDANIRGELAQVLAPTGGVLAEIVSAGSYADAATAANVVKDLVTVAAYEDIEHHAALVAGVWPVAGQTPLQVSTSAMAATSLGLAVGDPVSLVSRTGAPIDLDAVLVATWQPTPGDAYWLDDPLAFEGTVTGQTFTTHGPLVAAASDILALPGIRTVNLEWRAIPAIEGFRLDDADAIAADIDDLHDRIASYLPTGSASQIETGLPPILVVLSRAILVSRSEVFLLTAQFAILAGYAIILVAGLLVDRRRGETALLRSRGAGRTQVGGMALVESLLIAVPAILLAPPLAVAVVRIIGGLGPLGTTDIAGAASIDARTFVIAGLAGLLGVLALTVPAVVSGGGPGEAKAAAGRQSGRTLAGRTGIDIALLVVAGIALWQLRLYGAPLTRDARGVLGVDPLLVAAPAIGLLAGAILAVRVVPRLAEVAERILERRRGLVSPLGARQLARRPLRYTRSALLLMLAAALGTFALAHAATWGRSQDDQAAYQAATDVRIEASDYPDLESWAAGSAIRSVPGVAAAEPIERLSLEAGRAVTDGELVALDPTLVPPMLGLPPVGNDSDATAALAALAAGRPATSATPLPGSPRRLAMTLDAALALLPESGEIQPGQSIGEVAVSLVIIDGDERQHRLDIGRFDASRTHERLEIALTRDADGRQAAARAPLRLEAVEVSVSGSQFAVLEGTIDLTGIEVSDDDSGEGWTPVAFDPEATGWGWQRLDVDPFNTPTWVPYTPPRGTPGRIEARRGGASGEIFGGTGVDFRLAARPGPLDAIPAIVGTTFARESGAAVGDTVAVRSAGMPFDLAIVGIVDTFPPLDPGKPFAVVDLATLGLERFAQLGTVGPAQEWWVDLDPGLDAAAARQTVETLSGSPYGADRVIWRDAVAAQLTGDPVPLALIGALALGALAALAFAAIGFVVSATVSTSERMGEFALLQALGLSRRELAGWLSLEHAALLGFGLVAGVGLGLLLAWLVLPFATLTATGAAAVPAPVVVVPWAALLPLAALAVLLLVVTVAIVTRQLAAVRIGSVLRARDG